MVLRYYTGMYSAGRSSHRCAGRLTAPEPVSTFERLPHHAEVAELVDALASGVSRGNPVEVQVLSSAPKP